MSEVLLNIAYFPNIQYISKFIKYDNLNIEIHDSYSKQTYRNRCLIYGANGVQALTVPVKKNNNTPVKDIQIDYSEEWQKKHKRAILSAYKKSAFYDFYYPEIDFLFNKKFKFLIDLDLEALNSILKILSIKKEYTLTKEYEKNFKFDDLRDKIHPKVSKNIIDSNFKPSTYYQVFNDKYGFIQNLSILDMLFNEGPVSYMLLEESIV